MINKRSKANKEGGKGERARERKGGQASDRVTATGTREVTPAGGPKQRKQQAKQTNEQQGSEGKRRERRRKAPEG